ncbi:hypothetical protein [Cryobacterium melibiosiphilum]|nr:hypothetical protein [Cryobacterium melibiosiphilum]
MKIRNRNSLFAIGVAVAMAVGIGAGPAVAADTAAPSLSTVSTEGSTSADAGFTIEGADGSYRSIVPDEVNDTSVAGLSSTISMKSTDRIVLSEDARIFMLQDENGGVLLNSTNPTLGQQDEAIPAKFVVEGDNLVVTPVESAENQMTTFAACASSFWGNLIFNIGMAGVCAMLGIPTAGIATVACSMAVIGANLGIDWDSQC